MRTFIALVLSAAAFTVSAGVSTNSASVASDYARWIKPWAERPTTNSAPGGAGLKMIVAIVNGEVPLSTVTNMTPVERLNLAYHIRVIGSEITTNGSCRCYFASNTNAKSVPARQLPADYLKQLDELLARLPDDGLKLPPPGQRVVVQVLERDHWRVRVYDRATAPLEINAILALIDNPFDKSPSP